MNRNQQLLISCALAALAPLAAAGADRRQGYEQLTAASDKVVVGVVGAKSSYWGEDSRIYTDVVVSPDVTIKGEEEGAVVVRMLGGIVGDTKMTVSDGPDLPEGERAVLFLKRESDHFVVAGRAAGSIPVSSEEAETAIHHAFTRVEGATGGRRFDYKRSLVQQYLRDSGRSSKLESRAAVQTGCYSVDGAKWGATSATYKIGTSIPSAWAPSIDAAAATWSNAGAGFRLASNSSSINELSYVDLISKYGSSYGNTLALTTTWSTTSTNTITKAIIELNSKYQWSASGAANMVDVQNILTHEFGHWMRLLDIYSPTGCSEVTMWGSAAHGETKKRTLDQADIDGFVGLYGKSASSPTVGAPVLTSPANGATGVSTTAALSWAAASNATAYDLYLGTGTSPGFVATVTGTTYQAGSLTAGAKYYWRVVAKNSSASASSATFSFTVAAATAPAPTTSGSGPALVSPANGATGVSASPMMQWNPFAGATGYDVYIGTTSSPGYIGTVGTTAVTVSGLRPGTVYYWKVVARTFNGSYSSSVFSFRTY